MLSGYKDKITRFIIILQIILNSLIANIIKTKSYEMGGWKKGL